jgi:hypothetical protein
MHSINYRMRSSWERSFLHFDRRRSSWERSFLHFDRRLFFRFFKRAFFTGIPHDQMNISNFDVTTWHSVPTSFECCHCQCHHHINNDLLRNEMNNNLYIPEHSRHKRTKNEFFPFIFWLSWKNKFTIACNCFSTM